MKKFKDFLTEAKDRTEVLLFGRMNPITSGHEENVVNAHKIAMKHKGSLRIVGSHSHDPEKNPLSPEQKQRHMQRAFGHLSNTIVTTSSKEQPTIMHHAAAAHASGASHLVIAGGSDRAEEYKTLLNKYNGVKSKHGYYNFKSISVENTGARKAGISGTDMRNHAASGNYNQFKSNLPSKLKASATHAKEIYNDVRSGMGVKD
jgi:hypothetical protein